MGFVQVGNDYNVKHTTFTMYVEDRENRPVYVYQGISQTEQSVPTSESLAKTTPTTNNKQQQQQQQQQNQTP